MVNNTTMSFSPDSPYGDLLPMSEAPLAMRWGMFFSLLGITILGLLGTIILLLRLGHKADYHESLYGAPEGKVSYHVKVYTNAISLNTYILIGLQLCLLSNLKQLSPRDKERDIPRAAFLCHILLLLTMVGQAWSLWSFSKKFEPPRPTVAIELNNLPPRPAAHGCEDEHEYNPAPPYILERVHTRTPL